MSHVTCSIDGCTGKHYARTFCNKHYQRWKIYGDALAPKKNRYPLHDGMCTMEGCGGKFKSRGMCASHLERWRTYGDPLFVPVREDPLGLSLETGEKPCRMCGVVFPHDNFSRDSSKRDGRSTYCKPCMREVLTDWRHRNRETIRDYDHRRRARVIGTSVGPIDYELLWAESGGLCGICGYALDPDVPWPQPRFPSVDHIIPLARGGTHTQDNLQYACFVCNTQKGHRTETPTVLP